MLFVGDDWAEDHHDVEIQDETGRKLAARRLPEGAAGIARLHELIAAHLAGDGDPGQVAVAIETDRGLWVQALAAAGYQVYGLNPRQVARFKERYNLSGKKDDAADAHALADMIRAERHQLRAVAADTAGAQAVKVAARAHQTLIWERTRHTLRLRSALREFFPAALAAYADLGLTGADTLELLTRAPAPAAAAKLTTAQISAALTRARRRDVAAKTRVIKDALRGPQLAQPAAITAAYAATVQASAAVLITLNEQIRRLEAQVEAHFLQHPDAEIYLSQPGIGTINGARVLAEFGDAPRRYACAKARKNYAGSSPITRASGRRHVVLARFIRNDRLADALQSQAFSALTTSPGARAYYDKQRARGLGHNPALRQLSNRLVGILHGCLQTRTRYDEPTAWPTAITHPEPLTA
ncbi:MAG TPA: IS110 family transposase [Streptosporangiaceae bacterium]|nr:IS110 family transposase [Streptosporangiaceae bacterium]